MIEWISVFLAIFIADVCWVRCVRGVQAGEPLYAGLWAVALFIPTAFATVAYVHDPWLAIPAAIGHFTGTFFPVWLEKRRRTAQ